MKIFRVVVPSLVVVSLLALLAVASCSKSSSYAPTSPGGGGGGGDAFDSGMLTGAGASYAHVFGTAGAVGYHCLIHGVGMAGTVTVSSSSGVDSVVVGFGPGLVYNPAAVTIKVGGTVRWVNSSGVTHTATSN